MSGLGLDARSPTPDRRACPLTPSTHAPPGYLLGDACTFRGDDLLDERLDARVHGHDIHGILGYVTQRNLSDSAASGVQRPSGLYPLVDLLVPGFGDAIHAMAQRAEQEDVVQRPARGVHCLSGGPHGEPRRPHGLCAGRSGQTDCGKTHTIVLRPAVFRLPFRLGQQDLLPIFLRLLQRLSLGWHVVIHPIIEGFESHQNGAQGQITDRRHPVRLCGRSRNAGGRQDLGAGACRTFWRSACSECLRLSLSSIGTSRLAAPLRGSRALAHLSASKASAEWRRSARTPQRRRRRNRSQ